MSLKLNREYMFAGGVILLVGLALCLYLMKNPSDRVAQPEDSNSVVSDTQVDTAPEFVPDETTVLTKKPSASSPYWRLYGIVTAKDTESPVLDARLELFFDPEDTRTPSIHQTRTDDTGAYEFVMERHELPEKNMALAVQADNWAGEMEILFPDYTTSGSPKDLEHNFELVAGRTVRGRVVDQEGQPINQATVGLKNSAPFYSYWQDYSKLVYPHDETGADGFFEIPGVPAKDDAWLLGRADGYMTGAVKVEPEDIVEVELVLQKGSASLRGIVYQYDGTPMRDFPISAHFIHHNDQYHHRKLRGRPNIYTCTTFTDEKGEYYFPTLIPGWNGIKAGYEFPIQNYHYENIELLAHQERRLNIRLCPSFTVNGIVVDKQTGEPIPGVRVLNTRKEHGPGLKYLEDIYGGVAPESSVSNMQGEFSIEVNQWTYSGPNQYCVTLSYSVPDEYQLDNKAWEEDTKYFIQKDKQFKLEITRPYLVKGKVVAADEETPIADAEIQYTTKHPRDRDTYLLEPDAITDAAGNFEFHTKKEKGCLSAETDKSFALELVDFKKTNTTSWEKTIVMAPNGSISGTVYDSNEYPQPQNPVTLSFSRSLEVGPRSVGSKNEKINMMSTTDAAGRYKFDKLTPGYYTVSAGGYQGALAIPSQVKIEKENLHADVDLILMESIPFGGIVQDEDGNPIEGAFVQADLWVSGKSKLLDESDGVVSDSEGKFSFDYIPVETTNFSLKLSHPNYDNIPARPFELAESPVIIIMTKSPIIKFLVYHEDGPQVTDFRYDLKYTGRQSYSREKTGPERRSSKEVFHQTEPVVEIISNREYELSVYALDSERKDTGHSATHLIPYPHENLDDPIEIILQTPLELNGIVVDARGGPVEGAQVKLVNAGGRYIKLFAHCVSKEDGTFEFPTVQPGSYNLKVRKNYSALAQPIDDFTLSSENSPMFHKLILAEPSGIHGTVIGIDGMPMEGVRVNVMSYDLMAQRTDSQGQFHFEEVEALKHNLVFYDSDNAKLGMLEVEVEPGIDSEVTFDLSGKIKCQLSFNQKGETDNSIVQIRESATNEVVGNMIVVGVLNPDHYLSPGEYEVYSGRFSTMNHTGHSFTVQAKPLNQEFYFDLTFANVDVFIADDSDLPLKGKLIYMHESNSGIITRSEIRINRSQYELVHQPHGRCRAEFIADDGREFASDGWMEINEASDKILTLFPSDLAEQ